MVPDLAEGQDPHRPGAALPRRLEHRPIPYPERVTHAVQVRAAQGRTRTQLSTDPERGPWVTQMFDWRVLERLSPRRSPEGWRPPAPPRPTGPAGRTSPSSRSSPTPSTPATWSTAAKNVGESQRPGERKVRAVPIAEWTWSPQPAHPALVTRETWEAAQKAGKEHAGIRNAEVPTRQPRRRCALRSRMHCSQCGRGMTGITRTMPGAKSGGSYAYTSYLCPWTPTTPRDVARPRPRLRPRRPPHHHHRHQRLPRHLRPRPRPGRHARDP